MSSDLKTVDPEIHAAILQETRRQVHNAEKSDFSRFPKVLQANDVQTLGR